MRSALAVALAGLIFMSACGVGPDKSREDAHDVTVVGKQPPEVVTFNNHYPNVETKCDGHGHRVFVQSHDGATGPNVRVLPDPSCPGYAAKGQPTIVLVP